MTCNVVSSCLVKAYITYTYIYMHKYVGGVCVCVCVYRQGEEIYAYDIANEVNSK